MCVLSWLNLGQSHPLCDRLLPLRWVLHEDRSMPDSRIPTVKRNNVLLFIYFFFKDTKYIIIPNLLHLVFCIEMVDLKKGKTFQSLDESYEQVQKQGKFLVLLFTTNWGQGIGYAYTRQGGIKGGKLQELCPVRKQIQHKATNIRTENDHQ